jgi:Mor family transcriptional regulator
MTINFTEDQTDELVRLYKAGHTVADLMRLFQCSGTPILRVLRDNDVPRRAQGDELRTKRNQKILDMHDNGYREVEIARGLGISRQRVHQIICRGY